METITIEITTPFIRLDQLLKFAGVAESGAAAKGMILEGAVSVNGAPCTQRGRKLYPRDAVRLGSLEIHVR